MKQVINEKTEIRKLAQWISQLSWESLPQAVQEAAGLRVLDLVSAGLGAVKDPLMEAVIASYRARFGAGQVSVWGRSEKFPAEIAAKINAMLSHTLELDDVHPASKTHGSASIIPAAWAMAEYLGSSGKEFLTAVVCGYEVTARIGMALGVTAHRKKGWHATATCGIFGCAAAGAMLQIREEMETLGLSPDRIRQVRVYTYQVGYQQCAVSSGCLDPKNTMDAKFSALYGAAAALLFGKVTKDEFEPEIVENREIRDLIRKIHVSPDEELSRQYPAHWGCRSEVEFSDGTVLENAVSDPSGSFKNPLSLRQLENKARSLIGVAFPGREEEIAGMLRDIAQFESLPDIGKK